MNGSPGAPIKLRHSLCKVHLIASHRYINKRRNRANSQTDKGTESDHDFARVDGNCPPSPSPFRSHSLNLHFNK